MPGVPTLGTWRQENQEPTAGPGYSKYPVPVPSRSGSSSGDESLLGRQTMIEMEE